VENLSLESCSRGCFGGGVNTSCNSKR
jgi:hypothetical protein